MSITYFHVIFLFLQIFKLSTSYDIWVKPGGTGDCLSKETPCDFRPIRFQSLTEDSDFHFDDGRYDLIEFTDVPLTTNVNFISSNAKGAIFYESIDVQSDSDIFVFAKSNIAFEMNGIQIQYLNRSLLNSQSSVRNVQLGLSHLNVIGTQKSLIRADSTHYFLNIHIWFCEFRDNKYALKIENKQKLELSFDHNIVIANHVLGIYILNQDGIFNGFIRNSKFINNGLNNTQNENTFGGGISIQVEYPPDEGETEITLSAIFSDCIFEGNHARKGGGVFLMNYKGKFHTDFTHVNFFENVASYLGGAIYLHSPMEDLKSHIEGCIFRDNFSFENGGSIFAFFTLGNIEMCIRNTIFSRSTAIKDGGGIYALVSSGNQKINIFNSTFSENSANNRGGAMYFESASRDILFHMNQTQIIENTAFFGGGICSFSSYLKSSMNNVTYHNNSAYLGAGEYNFAIEVDKYVRGGSFTYNLAENNGGAYFLSSNDVRSLIFHGTIFKRNSGRSGGGIFTFITGRGNIEFDDCHFKKNVGRYGTALLMQYPSGRFRSFQLKITRCVFKRNVGEDNHPPDGSVRLVPMKYERNIISNLHLSHLNIYNNEIEIKNENENENENEERAVHHHFYLSDTLFLFNEGNEGVCFYIDMPKVALHLTNNTFYYNIASTSVIYANVKNITSNENKWILNHNSISLVILSDPNVPSYSSLKMENDWFISEDKNMMNSISIIGLNFDLITLNDVVFENGNGGGIFFDAIIMDKVEINNVLFISNIQNVYMNKLHVTKEKSIIDLQMNAITFDGSFPRLFEIHASKHLSIRNIEIINTKCSSSSPRQYGIATSGDLLDVENFQSEKNTELSLEATGKDSGYIKISNLNFKKNDVLYINGNDSSIIILEDSEFQNGEGIYIQNFISFYGSSLTFENNTKESNGGGMNVYISNETCEFKLGKDISFIKNQAYLGGAIAIIGNGKHVDFEIGKDQYDTITSELNSATFGSSFFIALNDYETFNNIQIASEYNIGKYGAYYFVQQNNIGKFNMKDRFDMSILKDTNPFGLSPIGYTLKRNNKIYCYFNQTKIINYECTMDIQLYNNNEIIKSNEMVPNFIKFVIETSKYFGIIEVETKATKFSFHVKFPKKDDAINTNVLKGSLYMKGYNNIILGKMVPIEMLFDHCSSWALRDLKCDYSNANSIFVGSSVGGAILFIGFIIFIGCSIYFCLLFISLKKTVYDWLRDGYKQNVYGFYSQFVFCNMNIVFCGCCTKNNQSEQDEFVDNPSGVSSAFTINSNSAFGEKYRLENEEALENDIEDNHDSEKSPKEEIIVEDNESESEKTPLINKDKDE